MCTFTCNINQILINLMSDEPHSFATKAWVSVPWSDVRTEAFSSSGNKFKKLQLSSAVCANVESECVCVCV